MKRACERWLRQLEIEGLTARQSWPAEFSLGLKIDRGR